MQAHACAERALTVTLPRLACTERALTVTLPRLACAERALTVTLPRLACAERALTVTLPRLACANKVYGSTAVSAVIPAAIFDSIGSFVFHWYSSSYKASLITSIEQL